MTFRDFWTAWQNFWFKAQSPLTISLFRILFGMVFLFHIASQYWQDFHVFFGPNPMIPYHDYVAYWWRRDIGANIFEFVPAEDFWHAGILVLAAVFAVMMILGLYTRFTIFISYILCCSIDRQNAFFCNAGDNMQRIIFFLLMFSHAGEGLSLDSYIKNRGKDWRKAVFDPPSSSPWAQRMLQVQMALAYISTGLLKINSTYWFSGNGVYLATRLVDFIKFPLPGVLDQALLDHRLPLYGLCVMTLVTELSLAILIWIKELRYWIILLGILMHLGIDWLLNIPVFEFVFMSMYVLFVDPKDLQRVGDWFLLFFRKLFKSKIWFGQSQQV